MNTKKRLIFTLLFDNGKFCQSRNFRCQKVGDINWLLNNYKFSEICKSLDELHIIDVNPGENSFLQLHNAVDQILKNVFIPVAVGGGINNSEDAQKILNVGADKVIINSLLYSPQKIEKISTLIGSQSIAGIVNYKIIDEEIFLYNWKTKLVDKTREIYEFITSSIHSGIGEIILNSVDKDGTGFGFDIPTIKKLEKSINIPIIASGGAGKTSHFYEIFKETTADGASTANLLNFMGDSLPESRKDLLKHQIPLANF